MTTRNKPVGRLDRCPAATVVAVGKDVQGPRSDDSTEYVEATSGALPLVRWLP